MDTTSTGKSIWKVDIAELTAAAKLEYEEAKKRPFYQRNSGFRFSPKVLPPGVDCLWVKYKVDEPTLSAEARTQKYVHSKLAKPGWAGLHIPRVFDYAEINIKGGEWPTWSFIMMEFVTGTPVTRIFNNIKGSGDKSSEVKKAQICLVKDRVVDALCFLLSLKPPPGASPGPVDGGLIQSFIFGRDDSYAPREFVSLKDLENWVNLENRKEKLNPLLTTADLVSEGLKLCYCDLNLENFLLEDASNPASRLTIIDFQHTSWLPYSFLVWELWNKNEGDMENQITTRCQLNVNNGNVQALHNIRLQRPLD
ncbi:hypothetical protein VM1G_06546 [Cytospora mali]|uniref:Aminoglycoside phosphotransferase domain-containing protein n=1 Tax=Cytospora mali TaxID=578113 RepID=A0A194W211_CYTMA|nr:hypothetical protein VM1G_06546 [Valsa mali]